MIHIVTCAYKAWEWAERHVEAIKAQEGDFMHYVGIDGCEKTLEAYKVLQHDRLRIFYTPKNLGKSILQNSIVSFVPDGANILFFDADDFIAKGTVNRLTAIANSSRMPALSLLPYANNGKAFSGHAHGVQFMKKSLYIEMGGFSTHLKVGADTDFMKRVNKQKRVIHAKINGLLPFYRTLHDKSLSNSKETGHNTAFRAAERAYIAQGLAAGKFKIPFVTSDLVKEV